MRVEYGGQWPGWLTAEEAIALVQVRRKNDGRWVLQNRYPGRTFFELENLGEPSRLEHAARAKGAAVVGRP